jgi:hypothetical protein
VIGASPPGSGAVNAAQAALATSRASMERRCPFCASGASWSARSSPRPPKWAAIWPSISVTSPQPRAARCSDRTPAQFKRIGERNRAIVEHVPPGQHRANHAVLPQRAGNRVPIRYVQHPRSGAPARDIVQPGSRRAVRLAGLCHAPAPPAMRAGRRRSTQASEVRFPLPLAVLPLAGVIEIGRECSACLSLPPAQAGCQGRAGGLAIE